MQGQIAELDTNEESQASYTSSESEQEAAAQIKEIIASCQKRLGKYCILQTLGSGSFSKTKLGIDSESGKYVAVKILHQDISEGALKTIVTEINALK